MLGDAVTAAASGVWTLGDLPVNRMGFGAKRLTDDRGVEVLRRAVELGVNHVDTAAFYPTVGPDGSADRPGRQWANRLIREALAPYPRSSSSSRRWDPPSTASPDPSSCESWSRTTCEPSVVTISTW